MRVSETLELNIPDDGLNVDSLKQHLAKEIESFRLISDGARWISDIAGADYLKATYQLDWWHYEKKLRAALCGEVKLQQELMNLLREGKRLEGLLAAMGKLKFTWGMFV